MNVLLKLPQMDVINILILTVALSVLLSGVLVFLRGKKTATKTGYLVVALPMFAWAISMILFRGSHTTEMARFWVQWLYFFPPFIPLTYILLVNAFRGNEQKNYFANQPRWLWLLLFPLIYLGYICFTPGKLITDVAIQSGENAIYFSSLAYLFYTVLIAIYWGIAFWIMYRHHEEAEDTESRQAMRLFMVGTFTSTIIAVIGNLFLPYIGVFYLNWIGQVGLTVMITLTFYSVINYNFLDMRVITAEIFTYSLIMLLVGRTLYSDSSEALTINIISLIGTIIFGFFLIRSVVKEIKARERAEELTRELKHMNDQKSKMLSIASHQFRSPLTSIEGYASLIKKGSYGELPDKLQEPINRILKSGKKLSHIVDDFLNISRIEDGRMEYNLKTKDLGKMVQEVVEEAESTVDEDKVDLRLETDEHDKYLAKVDMGKFEQVITNLVDNAIKYTDEGEVVVRLRKIDGEIKIEVSDSGIGIKPENTEAIFKQFSRSNEAEEVNVVGSGLGLYIARQIIRGHNGRIWATSPGKGEGATFHVSVAAADAEE